MAAIMLNIKVKSTLKNPHAVICNGSHDMRVENFSNSSTSLSDKLSIFVKIFCIVNCILFDVLVT